MRPLSLSWTTESTLPLSLPDIKTQLAITGDDFDELIIAYHLPAAVTWAETYMHRSIVSKQHVWVLSDFPRTMDQRIVLPRGKTQSLASIVYTYNDSTTTLSGPTASPVGTGFREDLRGDSGGQIYPAYNSDWPSVDLYGPNPVVLTFNAGWNRNEIPAEILAALMLYIGERIDMAGPGDAPKPDQLKVKETMLSPYVLRKFY